MADDLQEQLKKRRNWFFETQLRGLNMGTLSSLRADRLVTDFDRVLMKLISEQLPGREPLYIDTQEPVWTVTEGIRRNAFAGTMIGRNCNWLEYQEPELVIQALARIAEEFAIDKFGSVLEPQTAPGPLPGFQPLLGSFRRRPADWDGNKKGRAISRAVTADAKPWLLPELYYPTTADLWEGDPRKAWAPRKLWLENLVAFIADYEKELNISTGGAAAEIPPFDRNDTKTYRDWIFGRMRRQLDREPTSESTTGGQQLRDSSDSVKVEYLDRVPKVTMGGTMSPAPAFAIEITFDYTWNIRVQTDGTAVDAMGRQPRAADYPFSRATRYWTNVVDSALAEVYLLKPDSDMGLCTLTRMLYLFGTIPEKAFPVETVREWRHRTPPPPRGGLGEFNEFFAKRSAELAAQPDESEENKLDRERLEDAEKKLRVVLELSAQLPHTASIAFSPIVGEVLRKALHHYKFWLDEPLQALSQPELQKARSDIGAPRKWPDDVGPTEMEYWSENHYIMFASSEYLAGQLWEFDRFQPGEDFLRSADTGILAGSKRKDRGKARVLKWLNHRLMFGWAEFNSSGYLREHLFALLNLVDFAMDPEVRKKAAVVTDLLMFDIARFQHRGAMGAAGGRSQFKSKACGWDNAPGDVVEFLFGTRGMFCDEDSEIGALLATSTYKIPDVLLEIGARDKPPKDPDPNPTEPDPWKTDFIEDRSRVSITFDEAYKYGIWFSEESEEATSRREGYQPKLDRHFSFIQTTNDAIKDGHTAYGHEEDSAVFWWTTSSFVNKQIIRKSLTCVERYGLEKSGVWAKLPDVITTYIPLMKGLGLGGFLYGGVEGAVKYIGGLGPIAGLLELAGHSSLEDLADELAPLLDGSSRTRANIITYTNGDVMLSSIQNFRAGQLNYQSNVNQVTLNRAVNVFTTAGFAGVDLSSLTVGLAGFLVGLPIGGLVGGAIGAGVAIGLDEALAEGENLLGDEGDGPSWWTGYWALPMVVQHRGASIIAYQFGEVQDNLAEVQTHAWFPKKGFERTDELRSAAYEDDNSVFEEPFDWSKNGHWLFGKVVHPVQGLQAADWPEAYVGVFSNLGPDWLNADDDADVYGTQLETAVEKAQERIEAITGETAELDTKIAAATNPDEKRGLEDRKKQLQTEQQDLTQAWQGYPDRISTKDYFAEKDWNVEGDNIWIIQVGNKAEFGDFEQFKHRVSRAKVVIDDTGDLECTYHMPLPGGGSTALKLDYDDVDFTLDGAAVQADLYPRFESPFIRGQNDFPVNNRVEWGQRSYVIRYRDKSLLHDFHDFTNPIRTEKEIPKHKSQANTIRALVMFARTGEEEMEEFTKGVTTVKIGCTTVADGEIIAVGPIGENTSHDAEWIFFDKPTELGPDLTIELAHEAFGEGDKEAEWDVSFGLKALLADQRIVDCEISDISVSFTESTRRSRALPFTVKTDVWRPWQELGDSRVIGRTVLVKRPSWETVYYDHCDVLVLPPVAAPDRPVRHRRVHACLNAPAVWSEIPNKPGEPRIDADTTVRAYCRFPGHLAAFAILANRLYLTTADADLRWSAWTRGGEDLTGSPPQVVPFKMPGSLYVAPSVFSEVATEIIATGSDGHLYANFAWQPGRTELWRKLEVAGFTLLTDGDCNCVMANDRLFALADDGALWAADIDRLLLFPTDPEWVKLTEDGVALRNFTVVDPFPPAPAAGLLAGVESTPPRLLAVTTTGQVLDATFPMGQPAQWVPLGTPSTQSVPAQVRIACATPEADRLDIFVTVDGTVYTQTWNKSGWRGWRPVVEEGQGFRAADTSPMVIHRVKRQLELLVETVDGDLRRTWWS